MELTQIATFRSVFPTKFGIPKQSGLVEELEGGIVFEPKYRNPEALRGLEGFDYLWLIWGFSANRHAATSPVVRPPLLGGNTKLGVFATRSPFRPNALGLSSVRISSIDYTSSQAPVIYVHGADLMDGTPIYDIKPYVTYTDSHVQARSGFVDANPIRRLTVEIPSSIAVPFSKSHLETLVKVLQLDPRPHYHNDPQKVYGMPYDGFDVRFTVCDNILRVVEIAKVII